jgi:hypothetical protein
VLVKIGMVLLVHHMCGSVQTVSCDSRVELPIRFQPVGGKAPPKKVLGRVFTKQLKNMREAQSRGDKLKMSDEEIAFYNALEVNNTAVKVLGDPNVTADCFGTGRRGEEERVD